MTSPQSSDPFDYAGALDCAADRVARGWCQGVYGDRDGNVCLVGAVGIACGRKISASEGSYFEDNHRATSTSAEDLARERMKTALSYLPMPGPDRWNDEPGRTQEEVVEALRTAAARAREDRS